MNIEKEINAENKELTKNIKLEKHSSLTYRISPARIKTSMEKSAIKETPIHEFTPEFENFLINIRKYIVEDVETLNIEFDPKTRKRERNKFIDTWKKHFSTELVYETKTIKQLKRKIIYSIVGGVLVLSLCIVFALLAFLFEKRVGLQITYIVLNNLLFTLSWVFIWQGVSFWAYEYAPRKKKRKNLFIMFKANFTVGKSYSKYQKEKAKEKIDLISMERK